MRVALFCIIARTFVVAASSSLPIEHDNVPTGLAIVSNPIEDDYVLVNPEDLVGYEVTTLGIVARFRSQLATRLNLEQAGSICYNGVCCAAGAARDATIRALEGFSNLPLEQKLVLAHAGLVAFRLMSVPGISCNLVFAASGLISGIYHRLTEMTPDERERLLRGAVRIASLAREDLAAAVGELARLIAAVGFGSEIADENQRAIECTVGKLMNADDLQAVAAREYLRGAARAETGYEISDDQFDRLLECDWSVMAVLVRDRLVTL